MPPRFNAHGEQREEVLSRFVLHFCQALFEQSSASAAGPRGPSSSHTLPGSAAAIQSPEEGVQFIHKFVFSRFNTEVDVAADRPLPSAKVSLRRLEAKCQDSPDALLELDVIANAFMPNKKTELLFLLDHIGEKDRFQTSQPHPERTPAVHTEDYLPRKTSWLDVEEGGGGVDPRPPGLVRNPALARRTRRMPSAGFQDTPKRIPSYDRLPCPTVKANTPDGWKDVAPWEDSSASYSPLQANPNQSDQIKKKVPRADKMAVLSSIYPQMGEMSVLLRDVLYCLQGINGQHLQYSATYQRFLLAKNVPLARPLKLLASRMVASGNCFMRIADVTEKLLSKSPDALHAHPKGTESWQDPAGALTNPFSINELYSSIFEGRGPTVSSQPLVSTKHQPSLVVFAFLEAVRDELARYYKFLGDLETRLSHELSEDSERAASVLATLPAPRTVLSSTGLRRLCLKLAGPLKQLHSLARIVNVTASQIGGELLTTLADAQAHGDPAQARLYASLFEKSAAPMTKFVGSWLKKGELEDEYQEFFFVKKEIKSPAYFSIWRERLELNWSRVPAYMPEWYVGRVFAAGKMAHFVSMVKGKSFYEENAPSELQLVPLDDPAFRVSIQEIPSSACGATSISGGDTIDQKNASRLSNGTCGHAVEHLWSAGNGTDLLLFGVDGESEEGAARTQLWPYIGENEMNGRVSGAPSQNEQAKCWSEWSFDNFDRAMTDLISAETVHRKVLRDILIEENDLIGHLKAVKSLILLGAGDFSDKLCLESTELLVRNNGVELISQSEIDTCVEKAFRSSILVKNVDRSKAERLQPRRMLASEKFGESAWDFFALDYKCSDSPISVVLRDELLSQYRRLFALLWKIRRSARQQYEVWHSNMRNSFLLRFGGVSEILIDSHSLRQKILHVIQCWEAFLYHDILDPSFNTMIESIVTGQWTNLDDLIVIQESFLQALLYGSFLSDWPLPQRMGSKAAGVVQKQTNLLHPSSRVDERLVAAGDWRESVVLPDVHSTFLSASIALPSYKVASKRVEEKEREANCCSQIRSSLDEILQIAEDFSIFFDSLQITAYEKVSDSRHHPSNIENYDPGSPLDASQVDSTKSFLLVQAANLISLKTKFDTAFTTLLQTLKRMQRDYRSESIQALLTRVDLNNHYEHVRV